VTDTPNVPADNNERPTGQRWVQRPTRRGVSRRPMRYDLRTAAPQLRAAAAGIATDSQDTRSRKGRTMPNATTTTTDNTETTSDALGDDWGLSDADWEALDRATPTEAAEAQDDTTNDDTGGDAQEQPTDPDPSDEPDERADFADAFTPQAPKHAPAERDDRYRQRLRDAEAETERLGGLVESMQRAEVARLVASKLADPDDLFRDGLALADLRDDGGNIDAAKVDGAADTVLASHPHWKAPLVRYQGQLFSGSRGKPLEPPAKSFADAFGPRQPGTAPGE
jgi:hypothetical protein